MKFLTKINRNYLILLTLTLLIVTISAYFVLNRIILHNTKNNLKEQEFLIKKQIAEKFEIPNIYPIIEVKVVPKLINSKPSFKEIEIKNIKEDEMELYLEYANNFQIKNVNYSIKLRQSTFEREDLVSLLTKSLSILLLAVLIISFFVSRIINKTVWVDFEKNLRKIENFSFTSNKLLQLIRSDIEEFDRLNRVVNNLTKKLERDYLSLKEFSENASHEIQTPISVVLLHLGEILQQDLNEETFKKVHASINALKKLSSLNQSLILLTKIENRQFVAEKTISLNEIIERKIEEFSILSENKSLKISYDFKSPFEYKMNEQLAEILINNLISNAIRHNIEKGSIHFYSNNGELRICNSGTSNAFTNENIFNRFTKGNSKSFGLGLAIVKNICEVNQLSIHYIFTDVHCFSLKKL